MSNILLVSATSLEHNETDIEGIPIHIVGVGKVQSAINTTNLIKKYNPDVVVNFGSCGNLKHYPSGEVFEIGTVYDDFYGCVVPEHEPITLTESKYKLFTTDTFYDKDAVFSNHYTSMIRTCDFVDMEGYSIAVSCNIENKLLYCYKWVSDDGDRNSWEENAAIGFNNFKKLFKTKFL
jgi:adenosylhomocysteine nucleosidase